MKNIIRDNAAFLPKGKGFTMADLEARRAEDAKKKKEETTKTGSTASKANATAWILPDGTVHPLTKTYHEYELSENRKDFNKRFGTDFADPSNITKTRHDDRLSALNKGFVRMRYIPQHGTMTVEVNVGQWSKQRKNVEKVLLSHAGKIDKLHINLVDNAGQLASDAEDFTIFRATDRAKAIKNVVNEVKTPELPPPNVVREPTAIQRARARMAGGD